MAETTEVADYNPLNPDVVANPYRYYAALRDEAPVHRLNPDAPFFAISRHADIEYIFHHPDEFSSTAFQDLFQGAIGLSPNSGAFAGHRLLATPMMVSVDPPNHHRLRGLVNRGFTPRRIAALEPRLREIAEGFVGPAVERGSLDVVEDLAVPFPVTVIAELLGVEPELRDKFKHWSDATVIGLSGISSDYTTEVVRQCADEMADYIEQVAAERRASPRDDLISVLVSADGDDELSPGEVLSFVWLLLVAGNETTTNLIGNAMNALLCHPEQLKEVAENHDLIPQMVEEVLRYDTPILSIPRKAVVDVELPSGGRVEKDAFTMLLLGSANHDPRRYETPERFDIHREAESHLAFGHGIHFCLGASLARLEARVAFETLFAKCRDIHLDAAEAPLLESIAVRGRSSIPIAFAPV